MKAEVEKLFHELADQPPEVRERYFAEHEVDGSTRQEIEALLAFDSGASTYLMRDVSIAASRALPLLDANGRARRHGCGLSGRARRWRSDPAGGGEAIAARRSRSPARALSTRTADPGGARTSEHRALD